MQDLSSSEGYDLWADIAADLKYQRRLRRMEDDIYLRDFSKGFSGPRDHEGNLLTGRPPQEYVDRWRQVFGPESNYPNRKQQDYSAVIGDAIMMHATESGVVLQLGVALSMLTLMICSH